MKLTTCLSFTILLLTLSCQNEKKPPHVTKNLLSEIHNVEKQIFVIDTSEVSLIKTRKGAKIFFLRDIIDIDSTQTLTLELEEYYTLKDLIANNVQTLTTDGELLESVAVLNIQFKADGKEVKPKDGEIIYTELPIKYAVDDGIYNGYYNEQNQMQWKLADEQKIIFQCIDTTFLKTYAVDKMLTKLIPIDSLDYYERKCEEIERILERDRIKRNSFLIDVNLFLDNFNWINVDKIVEPIGYINLELNIKNEDEYDYVNNYVMYKGLRSFISYSNKNSIFYNDEIPIAEKTSMFTIAKKDDTFFSNLSDIDMNTNKEFEINLKKSSKDEINNFIDEY
jgi:hypothetical protein